MGRGAHATPRTHRVAPAILGALGLLLIGGAAALVVHVAGSTVRSATVTDGVVLSDGTELDLTGTFEVTSGAFSLTSWTAG